MPTLFDEGSFYETIKGGSSGFMIVITTCTPSTGEFSISVRTGRICSGRSLFLMMNLPEC